MEALSLRDRQKERTRDDMLNAALSLFVSNGYGNTTLQAIADASGVGIATLFRYFKNKPGVLAALIRKDMEEVLEASQQTVENPVGTPDEAITDLLFCIATLLEKPSKNLPHDKLLVPGVKTGKKELDEVIDWSDELAKKLIYKVLFFYEKKGELNSECSIKDLANIIFSVFNHHYISYVTGINSDYELLKKHLSRDISILFKPWLS